MNELEYIADIPALAAELQRALPEKGVETWEDVDGFHVLIGEVGIKIGPDGMLEGACMTLWRDVEIVAFICDELRNQYEVLLGD